MLHRKGAYLGTEIDQKWWRRYMKDRLFARGAGECWYDDRGFFFRRYLTKTPIKIAFDKVLEVKTGRWHAGRWAGGALMVKFIWKKDGLVLSSGFLLSRDSRETEAMVADFNRSLRRNH